MVPLVLCASCRFWTRMIHGCVATQRYRYCSSFLSKERSLFNKLWDRNEALYEQLQEPPLINGNKES